LARFTLVVLGLALCVLSLTGASARAQQNDCGTDLGCLVEASRSCRPAIALQVSSLDFFGMQITSSTRHEIQGGDAQSCTLHVSIGEQSMRFSEDARQRMRGEGVSDAEIARQESAMTQTGNELTSMQATCTFPTSELTALLSRWQQGTFSTNDLRATACSGSMIDAQAPQPSTSLDFSFNTTSDLFQSPRTPTGPPPANDNFADAEEIALPGSARGDSANATAEPEETRPCSMERATVWFAATPERSGTLTASTAGSAFDTVLAIYTGASVSDLTMLECNDDAGGEKTSEVRIPATAGTTYYIQVGGWSLITSGGPYELEVRLDP